MSTQLIHDELPTYEPYRTTGSWHSDVEKSEPDDRLNAADGATVEDAVLLEELAADLGITVETNYLAYLADDHSEFPAGKEHAANAQARFIAGGDPVDEYREAEGYNGIKRYDEDNDMHATRLAWIRAYLIAGFGPFTDPRNVAQKISVTLDDLESGDEDDREDDADREIRTDGGDEHTELRNVRGVGKQFEKRLLDAGITTPQELAEISIMDLTNVPGFGYSKATAMRSCARNYVNGQDDEDDREIRTDGGCVTQQSTSQRDELKAYEVQPGQVYRTLLGERVEIISDDGPGQKPLKVRYPAREPDRQIQFTSRYSFANAANYEGYEQLPETVDVGDEHDECEPMHGAFKRTPNCPDCGAFMRTGFDGEGFPAARCGSDDCPGLLDDRGLIEGGYFEEHGESS